MFLNDQFTYKYVLWNVREKMVSSIRSDFPWMVRLFVIFISFAFSSVSRIFGLGYINCNKIYFEC